MPRCVLPRMALGLALLGLAGAEPAGRLVAGQSSHEPAAVPLVRVQGEACTQACRQEYSTCLITEKGSPHCNVRLQRCLQACLAGKRR